MNWPLTRKTSVKCHLLLSILLLLLLLVVFWRGESPTDPGLSQPYRPLLVDAPDRLSLARELHHFQARLAEVDFATLDIEAFLGPFLQALHQGSPTRFVPFDDCPEDVIETLFLTRLALAEKLRALHAAKQSLPPAALAAIRDGFRAGRFLEDFIAAEFLRTPRTEVLAGAPPSLLVNPRWRDSEADAGERFVLRSGDLLLSRGNAVTSAAISRLSLPPAQFSHLAMVYRDPQSGQFHTVEAHIEIGAVVAPLDAYFLDGKVRAAVFRHQDASLAHRAAEYMFQTVRKASQTAGNIPYDFALDMSNPDALFCTEIAYWGYREASGGRVLPPLYRSILDPRIAEFHRAIGIQAERAFLPGDLECDPRFELVCEWRDVSRIRENHLRDAVLSAIYRWMAEENYRFHTSRRARLLGRTVYPARKIPWLGTRLLGGKFPAYMARNVFLTIVTLEDVSAVLEEYLTAADGQASRARGFGLTVPEAVDELDHLRRHDEQAWKNGRKTHFHHLLRTHNRYAPSVFRE